MKRWSDFPEQSSSERNASKQKWKLVVIWQVTGKLKEAICIVCTYDSVLYIILQSEENGGEVRKPTGILEEEFSL